MCMLSLTRNLLHALYNYNKYENCAIEIILIVMGKHQRLDYGHSFTTLPAEFLRKGSSFYAYYT